MVYVAVMVIDTFAPCARAVRGFVGGRWAAGPCLGYLGIHNHMFESHISYSGFHNGVSLQLNYAIKQQPQSQAGMVGPSGWAERRHLFGNLIRKSGMHYVLGLDIIGTMSQIAFMLRVWEEHMTTIMTPP